MEMQPADRYGKLAIFLHWTIAFLFLAQIALGLAMLRTGGAALQFRLIQWHKSLGMLILGLAVLRLAWRAADRRPAAAAGLSRAERMAAALVHNGLLGATLLVPLAGWALASSSTLRIPTFAFNLVVIPHLPLPVSEAAESFWRGAHRWLAYAAGLLAAGHVLAALRHRFVLRDDVLARMAPVLRRSPEN